MRPLRPFVRQHFLGVQSTLTFVAVILFSVLVGMIVSGGQHHGELRACARLNTVRASQNRTNRDAFEFDSLEATLLRASLKKQTSDVARTPEQRAETEKFLAKLRSVTSDLDWIPLTDCHRAVYDPHYRAPKAVRFAQAKAPPSVFSAP